MPLDFNLDIQVQWNREDGFPSAMSGVIRSRFTAGFNMGSERPHCVEQESREL